MARAKLDVTDPSVGHALPRAAGWIDHLGEGRGGWTLGGWAFLPPSGRFEALRAYWDGTEIGMPDRWQRADLVNALYWVPRAGDAGFMVKLAPQHAAGRLDVVGEQGGRAAARLSITFIAPERDSFPLPPTHLAERVSVLSGDAFRLSGMQIFTDLIDQMRRHLGDLSGLRVLDWGCGCGRAFRYLAANLGEAELLGCDIDPEGVEWCAQNLPGHFSQSSPEPPLPYDDGEVDVILASSVFTHLSEGEQRRWLGELRRILSPNGLLLASVSGEYAYTLSVGARHRIWSSPGSMVYRADALKAVRRLRRAGFIDACMDRALDGIAPAGYYRLVFQSPTYTKHRWSEMFEIVDYLDRGLNGHQDLVVMRPPQHARR